VFFIASIYSFQVEQSIKAPKVVSEYHVRTVCSMFTYRRSSRLLWKRSLFCF